VRRSNPPRLLGGRWLLLLLLLLPLLPLLAALGSLAEVSLLRALLDMAGVDVHVHTLKFVAPPAENIDTVWVSIEPLLTSRPLATKKLDRKNAAAPGGLLSLDFAESLELLPGAIGTRRLQAALASEIEADAILVYTLWGSTRADEAADEVTGDGSHCPRPRAALHGVNSAH
jgi:hypothetical protein